MNHNNYYISDNISICSYKMHSFNQGAEFLKNNITLFDIWCLQEHWLYPSTSCEINCISTEYLCNIICDVSDDDVMKPGRPKRGLAIMWNKSRLTSLKIIGSSINNRVMAAVLTYDIFVMCICKVYLPCFEQSEEHSTVLMEYLSYIDYVHDLLLREHNYIELCIIGDCNFDLHKLYNSQYVACMEQIITDYDLILATKALAEEGGYTYYNEKNNVYSMIDHCFLSRKLYGKCEQVAIVDKVGNFSDHLPVNVKLNVIVCHYSSSENVRLYAKWDDESNKMYYNNTRDGLYFLDDGCNCSNVICNDSSHNTCIDNYCEKIIRILHDSTVWGCVTRGKEKGKFAWSRLLDEAKRHAKRQHKIWMQSGKNRVGVEFDNMNVARREYKKELKKAKNLKK